MRRLDNASKLLPVSRIVYNEIYEIRYDVKACPFGEVHERYQPVLKAQFKALYPSTTLRGDNLSASIGTHDSELTTFQNMSTSESSGEEEVRADDILESISEENVSILLRCLYR